MKQKYEKEESDSFEEDMEERMRDIRKATISPFYADGTPFDGVFYVDGDDEPLAIDLKNHNNGGLGAFDGGKGGQEYDDGGVAGVDR